MTRCTAKTTKGERCKKTAMGAGINLCHIHEDIRLKNVKVEDGFSIDSSHDALFVFPNDVWNIILLELDIWSMGNLHLASKYFYCKVKLLFDTYSYYTILEKKGKNIEQTPVPLCHGRQWYSCHMAYGYDTEKLIPIYLRCVESEETPGSPIKRILERLVVSESQHHVPIYSTCPLINQVDDYGEFITTLNGIDCKKLKESELFRGFFMDFKQSESLEEFYKILDEKVVKYAFDKTVDMLTKIILNKPSNNVIPGTSIAHYFVKWSNKNANVLKVVSDAVREQYPEFKMCVIGNSFVCLFSDQQYY